MTQQFIIPDSTKYNNTLSVISPAPKQKFSCLFYVTDAASENSEVVNRGARLKLGRPSGTPMTIFTDVEEFNSNKNTNKERKQRREAAAPPPG